MTIHPLSPGYVKIFYTQNLLTHVQTLPVQPSGSIVVGSEPSFTPNVGSPVSMSTAVDAWVALLQPSFGSDTSFSLAEFWSQPTPEDDPVWVYTHPIGEVGTAATASVDLLQSVLTFRTALGGIFRLYLMEISGATPVNSNIPYPIPASPTADQAAYLIGSNGWVLGRDNAKLVVPIRFKSKFNDALRKKRGL